LRFDSKLIVKQATLQCKLPDWLLQMINGKLSQESIWKKKMTCERICRYDAEGQSKVADDDTKIVKKVY